MSWTISPVTSPSADAAGLRAALQEASYPQQDYGHAESVEAIQVAIDALVELAPICGEFVSVSASGHANPGHQPEGGWSADTFNLHVSAAVRPAGATE